MALGEAKGASHRQFEAAANGVAIDERDGWKGWGAKLCECGLPYLGATLLVGKRAVGQFFDVRVSAERFFASAGDKEGPDRPGAGLVVRGCDLLEDGERWRVEFFRPAQSEEREIRQIRGEFAALNHINKFPFQDLAAGGERKGSRRTKYSGMSKRERPSFAR